MSVIFSLDLGKGRRLKPHENPLSGFYMKGTNGSSVILVHGLTGTPQEMRSLAVHLNRKGYSIACPRLAKHGEPLNVLKYARWQEFYKSVKAVLTEGELAGENGPIFASGLSLGALLSLLLAHEFPDRISAVSCLAPTLFYDGWNTPLSKYFLPLARTPLRYVFYFKEEPPYGIKNEAIRQRIHRYYKNARLEDLDNIAQYGYPYFPVTLLYQLQLLVKHLTKMLPDIRQPVQLIQAKDDDMTSTKNSKFIYDRIGSAMKEIILLYDSYHIVTADQERETVARKMEGFFERAVSVGCVTRG
jgi:carboxylesterase